MRANDGFLWAGRSRAVRAIGVLVALLVLALPARALAAQQPPTVLYAEDFESNIGVTPVMLSNYTGASGMTYGADPAWLTGCNGALVSFNSPDAGLAAATCTAALDYSHVRQMAWALGSFEGASDPAANHAVTAYTEGNPGANKVQFETASAIPLLTSNRFLSFSVDATETNCFANHAQFEFFLLDGPTAIPTFTTPIDPCTAPPQTIAAPPIGGLGSAGYSGGTYFGNKATLFSGSSVGIRMINAQGSGTGNDAAFDNVRIVDATPTLDKSFSPAVVNVGESSTLTFTITNTTENGEKDGWSFTDTLPAGLAIAAPNGVATTCAAGTTVDAVAGASTVQVTGNLGAGMAGCTVTVDVTSATAATYANGPGNVSEAGLNPPQDATVQFTAADLALTKAATPAAALPNGDESYQLTVTNNGPDSAQAPVVVDTLPAQLSFVSADPECSASGPTVTCSLPSLASGTSHTFTVLTHVAPTATAGTIDNTAMVSSDTFDPVASNDSATDVVPIAQADLSIVKTASPNPLDPSANETFTLAVHNDGPNAATNVRVGDTLPAGLTFVSASDGCTNAAGTVSCMLPTLAGGATATISIVVKVPSSFTHAIDNTATVTSDVPDPNPGNNSSTIHVPIAVRADLSLVKTASTTTPGPDGQVVYTLVVHNAGPSDATGVRVVDPGASGLQLQAAKPSQGSCAIGAGGLSCALGDLADGGSAQVQVVASVPSGGPAAITNSAGVSADQSDPQPANDHGSQTITPAPAPQPVADLAVVKRASVKSAKAGQRVTYTIVVSNGGPNAAPAVSLTDTFGLPARIASVKTTAGSCKSGTPLTCALGSIAPGAKVTVTVVGVVTRAGTLRNAVGVTSAAIDPSTADDLAVLALPIAKPALRVTKTASTRTVHAGGRVIFTIRVANPSGIAVRDVRVCDRLPSGLIYAASTPRAKLSKGRRCWTARSLAAGAHRSYRIAVRVTAGTSGRKANVATATSPDARSARATRSVRVVGARPAPGGVTG